MQIDCQNLPCPGPVIKTKKALENLEENDSIDILVNDEIAAKNVRRFAKNEGYEVFEAKKNELITLTIKKTTCQIMFENDAKTLLIKDDKVGEGELGENLMIGFLSAMIESTKPPKEIFFINRGVLLTSANENSIKVIKKLEGLGCKIYSCGVCLEYFGLKVQIGEVGNAFQVIESLLRSEGVLTL